jgi:hypothetical protein
VKVDRNPPIIIIQNQKKKLQKNNFALRQAVPGQAAVTPAQITVGTGSR